MQSIGSAKVVSSLADERIGEAVGKLITAERLFEKQAVKEATGELGEEWGYLARKYWVRNSILNSLTNSL